MNETVASTRVVRKSNEEQGSSGTRYAAVTDGVDYMSEFKGFIVAVAGDVEVVGADNNSCVLPAMVAGVVHPCYGKVILASGTTATGIVAVS